MFKLISLASIIVVLATITAAEPNQPEITKIQERSNSEPTVKSQQIEPVQLKIYNLLDNKINGVGQQVQQTKEEIDKKLDYQMQCNEKAIDSVNTSISGATYALTIIGIAIAVIGIITGLLAIGLGVYVASQVKNVTHIAKQSKTIRDDHLKIRDEVRELNDNIKNNMSKLYDNLKKEETAAIVDRLAEVPEDIVNLSSSLVSRQIPKELFSKMKKAYQSLDSTTLERYKHQYLILFFQHFSDLALFDKDLQSEIENNYLLLVQASFKNDITQTSEEFLKKTIKEGNILDFREKLKRYFIVLGQSKFANYLDLHKHLYNTLATKENKFDFYLILQQENLLKDIAKIYGQFLLSDYKGVSGNTEVENKILIDIIKMTETQK